MLLLALPQMYGVGYPILEGAIRSEYVLGMVLLFMVAKMVATSLTIAIGGSGGVFAPSLFIGAMLGTGYGQAILALWPAAAGPAGAYGLVGMGAVFAAVARAPLTAVIIIFDLTGEYHIILPLMFAIALSTRVGSLLSRDTIYTLKLRRRGIDITRRHPSPILETLRVGDAMGPVDGEGITGDLARELPRLRAEHTWNTPWASWSAVERLAYPSSTPTRSAWWAGCLTATCCASITPTPRRELVRVIDAAELRRGDFVTVTTDGDRRAVAVGLQVVRPESE